MSLIDSKHLIGKTIMLNGEPTLVETCVHEQNFASVRINGKYLVSYAEFADMIHTPSVEVTDYTLPTPSAFDEPEEAPEADADGEE